MIVSVRLPAMSGPYEFTNYVTAGEQPDQAAASNDGHAVDFLVGHDRRHLGQRLVGGDAEHLARHDVAHEPAGHPRRHLARARSSRTGCAMQVRIEKMPHELSLAQHPDDPALRVDDG